MINNGGQKLSERIVLNICTQDRSYAQISMMQYLGL